MTHFRVRWKKLGGHVHVRVFTAGRPALTHGKNGDLVFREDEWEAFLRCFQDRGDDTITILPEDVEISDVR
jgi:hypothetical protein